MARLGQARQVIPIPHWSVIKTAKKCLHGMLVSTNAGHVQVPFVRSVFQTLLSFDFI